MIRNRGDVEATLAQADKMLEAEYFVPYFIHTPMEPPAALVDANVRPVQVITSTQSPNQTRQYVAEALGIEKSDVACEVTLLGGGFGRKSKPDFACEAAILSKMTGAPVRVQWTREDEIRNGYYHTASAHHLKAGLDASGKVTAWSHSGAWPSILGLWNPAQKHGAGFEYGLGLIDTPYNEVPNIRIENGEADIMIRVGWYRSVNNIQHAFAMNCFTHEVAEAAGRDHLDLLLEMIGEAEGMDLAADGVKEYWNYGDSIEEWPIMPNRLSNVLLDRRGKVGLRQDATQGTRARPCGSPRLPQLRGERRARGRPRRRDLPHPTGGHGHRLRPLREPGRRAQAARGRGHLRQHHRALRQDHDSSGRGGPEQLPRLPDHAHINDAPLDVRVHIVEDFVHLRPCGVGEPGVPPYTPALVNAIYNATGKRIRTLPIGDQLKSA